MKRFFITLVLAGVGVLMYVVRNQATPGHGPSSAAPPVPEGLTQNSANVLDAAPGTPHAIFQLTSGTNAIGSPAYELQCIQEYDRLSKASVPELKVWKELYVNAGVPESVLYTAIRRTYVAVSERKQYTDLIDSELQSLTEKLNHLLQSEELSESQRHSLEAVNTAATSSLVDTLKAKMDSTLSLRAQELLDLTGLPDRRAIDLAFAITPVQYAPIIPTNAP